MATRTFQLPEYVRLRLATLGPQSAAWTATLAERVRDLEQRWQIGVGEALSGGSESFVAEAVRADGSKAIVKIGIPGCDLAREARVYRLADGRGYARLEAHDEEHNAILIERLGPSLAREGLPVGAQFEALCAAMRESWIRVASPEGLTTGAEKARWLAGFILATWRQLDEPCTRAVVDRARDYAGERETAFSPATAVLVHGDAHADNALKIPGADEPPRFKFIDPDGLFAEPACDLASPMREWNRELLAGDAGKLARERCAWLGELAAVDETAIWQWGFIERVSTGLHLKQLGIEPDGSETLAVAEMLVKAHAP